MNVTIDGTTYHIPLDIESSGSDAIEAWLTSQRAIATRPTPGAAPDARARLQA